MAIWRTILRYLSGNSGLEWTITNYLSAASPAACLAAADPFNTAYLNICPTTISLIDYRVSDVAVYRDEYVQDAGGFTRQNGALAGASVPDSCAALWTGYGSNVTQGQSKWWFHGISVTQVSFPDDFAYAGALALALDVAAKAYLKQYRPVLSPAVGLPVVNPPVAFPASSWSRTLHDRRLGRPFLSNGQARRYRT